MYIRDHLKIIEHGAVIDRRFNGQAELYRCRATFRFKIKHLVGNPRPRIGRKSADSADRRDPYFSARSEDNLFSNGKIHSANREEFEAALNGSAKPECKSSTCRLSLICDIHYRSIFNLKETIDATKCDHFINCSDVYSLREKYAFAEHQHGAQKRS
jgi:hypothetical protein